VTTLTIRPRLYEEIAQRQKDYLATHPQAKETWETLEGVTLEEGMFPNEERATVPLPKVRQFITKEHENPLAGYARPKEVFERL
jgi:hypothetical protein